MEALGVHPLCPACRVVYSPGYETQQKGCADMMRRKHQVRAWARDMARTREWEQEPLLSILPALRGGGCSARGSSTAPCPQPSTSPAAASPMAPQRAEPPHHCAVPAGGR